MAATVTAPTTPSVALPEQAFTWWWRRGKEARALMHTQWLGEAVYPERSKDLVRQGWRARTYRRYVSDIAATVSRDVRDNAYPAPYHGGQFSTVVGAMFEHYDAFRTAVVRVLDAWSDLPFAHATGWLTDFTLNHRADTEGRPWWRSDELLTLPRDWAVVADLPVDVQVLAWTAGLTPGETLIQHCTTGLDPDALRALAALR